MLRILGSRRYVRSHKEAAAAATAAGHHGYIRETTRRGQLRTEWVPLAQGGKQNAA